MAEAEVRPEALEGVLQRLDDFVRPFAASLKHDTQRQHAAEYVAGLVFNVKRKNIETIAYLHEQDRQPMQKFIGQKPWEGEPMIDELAQQVGASMPVEHQRPTSSSTESTENSAKRPDSWLTVATEYITIRREL